MATRQTKMWEYNSRVSIDSFDLDIVNADNLVNQLLVLKQEDITFSFIMNLFGEFNGKALCHPYDTFKVPKGAYQFVNQKGKLVSNTEIFTTTIGIWVFNVFFIRDCNFGKIFGYINTTIDGDSFEDIQQDLIYALLEDRITTDEYKKFLNYSQFFMPFETILCAAHTEKILTCTKAIDVKKKELYKQYKDKLDAGDVVTAEKVEKELIDYANEYLKGDPGLDQFKSKAGSTENNFKNVYVMKGAVKDPDPNAKQEFNVIMSNYLDGIQPEEYSTLANSLAAGPYSRAKKTEVGGYWEKLITASTGTVTLDKPGSDCGTDKCITVTFDKKNIKDFMYCYIKEGDHLVELTSENKDKYIGKTVKVRSALFCKSKTGICNKCAGNFFYRRGGSPNVGLTCAEIASRIKVLNLKAFHDSSLKTAEIDPIHAFSL